MATVPDRGTFEALYAGQAPWDIGRPNNVLVDVADRITGSVLDAGCGTGENALFFAGRGCTVTGIDFIEEAINRARRKAAERGLTATFLVMDALALKDLPIAMKLSEVIPWGRSFEEYRRLFALTDGDLAGTVLGCGDGPASFNAEATALGHRVVSCDPIYAFSAGEIERRVEECYDVVIPQVVQTRDGFVWDYFRDPNHLGECRIAAMRRFLADFDRGKQDERYVTASLPTLPFADGQFSLALVSHFLFLYSEQLDLSFHIAAFKELLRVATEVRVFPLLDLDRQWSRHVGPVCEDLTRAGFVVDVVTVDYEFQRADDHAGNRMLRVRRGQAADPSC